MQNPHHFLHVGPHLTCDTRLPCRYTRKNSPSTPSPPLTREKLAQHALKRRFSAIFRALGEFCHAQAGNKPSRANFFTHRTQPRGNCETAITTATADADQHETTITDARPRTVTIETTITSVTEKLTQNAHFSPTKAMAVSTGPPHWPAKATQVSREISATPAPSYNPTHQKTRT